MLNRKKVTRVISFRFSFLKLHVFPFRYLRKGVFISNQLNLLYI